MVAASAHHRFCLAIALWIASGSMSLAETGKEGSPFQVRFEQRSRYEVLDSQFRSGGRGGDQVAAFRTLLRLDADWDPVAVMAEIIDSRQALADPGSALTTATVDAFSVLQAHVLWKAQPEHEVRLGRMAFDLGSRRLVARNRYRNTINSFTGLRWNWRPQDSGWVGEAFYLLPVQRLPADVPSLLANEVTHNGESFRRQFWGLVMERADLPGDSCLALSYFGLHESPNWGRCRRLHTVALRWHRAPEAAAFDWELETALQWGRSRLVAAGPDLDHLASFTHASVGYTAEVAWKPRIRLAIDYASGDSNPGDGHNHRFDTLYGARRFEFGPTGIYGAIARSNLISPELRLTADPTPVLSFMIAHRGIWLASAQDAWTTGGVVDPTGGSGRHVGQQVEARLRWRPKHERFEVGIGIAHLFTGRFLDRAPSASGQGDTTYGYAQTTLRF